MQVKKQQLELDRKQWTSSKLGKEYDKAVYCCPAYLSYMENTSCEMPDWMNLKLESRLPGEVSTTLKYTDDRTLKAESKEELRSLLMKVKEESEESGFILNIQKTRIVVSGHITSWQIDGEKMETVTDFIFWDSKINADSDAS